MSAVQHEQAAAAHEGQATEHADQYQAPAQVTKTTCDGKHPCWTSVSNPTQGHLDGARKHHKMAEDHRAAAQALRTAEAQACVGISDEDRDISPFYHRDDIASVTPAVRHVTGKQTHDEVDGAVVVFRAIPGLTAVTSTGDGFAVTIESQDANTAKEVLRRAQALKT